MLINIIFHFKYLLYFLFLNDIFTAATHESISNGSESKFVCRLRCANSAYTWISMSHVCESSETTSELSSVQIPIGTSEKPEPITSLFTSHLYRLTWLGGPQVLTGFFKPRPLLRMKSVVPFGRSMLESNRSRRLVHLFRRRRLREWHGRWKTR